MKYNNETLRLAVNDWLNDRESAIEKYGHISIWDTEVVDDMSGLFCNAETFDEPIENWNVSNVVNMSCMFFGAKSFNQSLDKWKFHPKVKK